jgi:hypothetical protein
MRLILLQQRNYYRSQSKPEVSGHFGCYYECNTSRKKGKPLQLLNKKVTES